MKRFIGWAATAAIVSIGALMVSPVSAAIVCDSEGNCWHVKDKYEYPPTAGIVVHDDTWKWRDEEHDRYRWREHEGRGYWRDGVWITF